MAVSAIAVRRTEVYRRSASPPPARSFFCRCSMLKPVWIWMALWSLSAAAEPPRSAATEVLPSLARGDEWARQVGDALGSESARTAHRQQIERNIAEFARLRSLDQRTRQGLADLLDNQDRARLDRQRLADPPGPIRDSGEPLNPEYIEFLRSLADQHTRDYQAVRSLLGNTRFEQFVDYQLLLGEHLVTAGLDSRLQAQDKLTTEQKTRLAQLMHEDARLIQDAQQRRRARNPAQQGSGSVPRPDLEELGMSYLDIVQSKDRQLAQAPSFLTPRQIQQFAHMQLAWVAYHREVLDASRRAVGVSTQAPLLRGSADNATRLRTGKVRLRVELSLNHQPPMATTLVSDNNVPIAFALGDLQVQATPRLFADDWREVGLQFYEATPNGRRRLESIQMLPDGLLLGMQSEHTLQETFYGAQGYAIFGKVTLAPESPSQRK
jgi:hypothetical protein